MKHNWEIKKLGEVCHILNGFAFKSINYLNDGIRVIRIANVQKGEIIDSQPQFYPLSTSNEIEKYLLEENDLLVSLTGNVGRVGMMPQSLLPAALNQRVACLRVIKENTVDKRYLFNILNSDYFEYQCIFNAQGIAQKNISTEWLKTFEIYVPPLTTQQAISSELDLLNSLINKQKAQLTELDRLAQSVFYDMFGDPIENEKGWEVKKLAEIGQWQSGGTPSRAKREYFCGNIPWLTSGELNDIYVSTSKEFITKKAIEDSNTKLIPIGSLLLGMYDTAALKSSISSKEVTCNQAIAYATLNNKLCNTLYVYYVVQINKETYKKEQRGIRQKNLNLSMIKNFNIILPPLALQKKFATTIEKIEAQKALVKQSIAQSEQLLASRMQYYFE